MKDFSLHEVQMYECPWCDKKHEREHEAAYCLFSHAKEQAINTAFEAGYTLGNIAWRFGIHWDLNEKQKQITKDSCFVISYLQCCEKPAYRISHISAEGAITVWGKGSWSGGYCSEVSLNCLEDPRPKEELYRDPR